MEPSRSVLRIPGWFCWLCFWRFEWLPDSGIQRVFLNATVGGPCGLLSSRRFTRLGPHSRPPSEVGGGQVAPRKLWFRPRGLHPTASNIVLVTCATHFTMQLVLRLFASPDDVLNVVVRCCHQIFIVLDFSSDPSAGVASADEGRTENLAPPEHKPEQILQGRSNKYL